MVKPSSFVENLTAYKITPQDVWSDTASNNILKLDWNESSNDFEFYGSVIKKLANIKGLVAWYPDCLALKLTENIGRYTKVDSNLILTFPGSDVALETVCRAYLGFGDNVLVPFPTYENFFVFVLQTGATLERFELPPPFELDVRLLAERIAASKNTKAVYLVRPNNPCGYLISCTDVDWLSAMFPEVLFIVDEAYIEFANTGSCVTCVVGRQNLIVVRTFSKAFGMAGMRLGYLCASLEIVNTVNKIRNGKNVSMISQYLGIETLQNLGRVEKWVETVRYSKGVFEEWCSEMGIEYYKSFGNFVLCKVQQPIQLCSKLKSEYIYIRDRSSAAPGCVRITIGNLEQTNQLVKAIDKNRDLL